MATFKNMLDALGDLETGVSYELSESLTQMAIDYASLFNVSIDRAMQQFQSVLSGQIRSIRTTSGYDVSEATIFNIYQQLGGNKTMRQLSQLEKRLLRILAVQQQLERTGAVGDFTKTINQSANLLKQTGETLKEIGRWFGQLTMVYLQPFLTKLLGGLIAIREVLKSMNIAKGYQYEDFSNGLFGDVQQKAEETEEAVKSLKRTLLGFDKINTLGSNGSNNALGEDTNLILDAIKKYESNMDSIKNKSNQIAENILKWLGYEKEVDEVINESGEKVEQITWNLKDGFQNIEKILLSFKSILAIVGTLATYKLVSSLFTGLPKVVTQFKDIKDSLTLMVKFPKLFNQMNNGIPLLIGKIALIVGAIIGIITLLKHLYKTNEEFKKSVDEVFSTLKEIFSTLMQVVGKFLSEAITRLQPFLKIIQEYLKIVFDVLEKKLTLWLERIQPLIEVTLFLFDILLKVVNALYEVYNALSFKNLFS
jgi:phage-related protein